MDFKGSLKYLESTVWFGINPGLERISAITELLGQPQEAYPSIQVTGTNGKTSTTWYLAHILKAHGLKVGTYTSPHLESYAERFQVDGEPISEATFAHLMTEMEPILERVKERQLGEITHFEVLTALAFRFFQLEEVDVAVAEVGMGGRWDATSVSRPKLGVITNVSLDHTDRLGQTVGEIAAEKAAIIKDGAPVVCGPLHPSALAVVKARCATEASVLSLYDRDFSARAQSSDGQVSISIKGLQGTYENLATRHTASHQLENIAVAAVTAEKFLKRALDPSLLVQSILPELPGRLEIWSGRPLIVLDGAHNPDGMRRLVRAIKDGFQYRRLVAILAVLEDKDVLGILKALVPAVSSLQVSETSFYRRAEASAVAPVSKKNWPQVPVDVTSDLKEALERGLSLISEEDMLLVTGSLYTVGEARPILRSLVARGASAPGASEQREFGCSSGLDRERDKPISGST